jgi:hypothetical protein
MPVIESNIEIAAEQTDIFDLARTMACGSSGIRF